MKKQFVLITLLVTLSGTIAWAQSFERGTNVVNVGVGFGSALGGRGTQIPAISASYERGIWAIGDDVGIVSVGGYLGVKSYHYQYSTYTDKWNYIIVGARGTFHYVGFSDLPKLDPYAGIMVSYNHLRYTSNASSWVPLGGYGSAVGATGFIGARWYFSDNFAGYAELGYGVAHFNIGASLKF